MDFIDYLRQHPFNSGLNPFSKKFDTQAVSKTLDENSLKADAFLRIYPYGNTPLFMGGVMYLYRKLISDFCNKLHYLMLACCIVCTVIYYIIPHQIGDFEIVFYKNFVLCSFWLIYAIEVDSKILGNRVMKFISGISLEIYLSHMVVFRFMEKTHVQYLFGENSWL